MRTQELLQNEASEVVWLWKASPRREELIKTLRNELVHVGFLGREQTEQFEQVYWQKARTLDLDSANPVFVLNALTVTRGHRYVTVMHQWADVTGALKTRLCELVKSLDRLQEILGPNLCFADNELTFGYCRQVDGRAVPTEAFRWWV